MKKEYYGLKDCDIDEMVIVTKDVYNLSYACEMLETMTKNLYCIVSLSEKQYNEHIENFKKINAKGIINV